METRSRAGDRAQGCTTYRRPRQIDLALFNETRSFSIEASTVAQYRIEMFTFMPVVVEASDPDQAQEKANARMLLIAPRLEWNVHSVTRVSSPTTYKGSENDGIVLRQGFSGV